MKTWRRKLRAVLSTGLIWGIPAAIVGAIGGSVASIFGGPPLLEAVATGCVGVGGLFFLLGTSFATVLTIIEGRRSLGELSPWRAALWGALAGGALPVAALLTFRPQAATLLLDPQLLEPLLAAIASVGGLGAALAGGTVAVAKQAPGELTTGRTALDLGLLDTPGDVELR